jgi:hypothetical protein
MLLSKLRMARVIMISTKYLSNHPRAGEPTLFVEKIWQSIYTQCVGGEEFDALDKEKFDLLPHNKYPAKHHTIRPGKRWKVGDKCSLRFWSGKPYRSKQTKIAPDLEVQEVYDIEISKSDAMIQIIISRENRIIHCFFVREKDDFATDGLTQLMQNDGLSVGDFVNWFLPSLRTSSFIGQIICWEKVNYQ